MKMNTNHLIALVLFLFSLGFYIFATSQFKPFYSYHHELYQARAFLQGRFDVVSLPNYYHDVTVKDGNPFDSAQGKRTYLPFGPTPALLLLPFFAIFGTNVNPQYVGAFIGALNVALVYLLLKKSAEARVAHDQKITIQPFSAKGQSAFGGNNIAISLFFAFGTVHFYSVFIGSTWYFAQVVGVFLLLLALNLILSNHKSHLISLISGFVLGLATMARVPLILSILFFLIQNMNGWRGQGDPHNRGPLVGGLWGKARDRTRLIKIFLFIIGLIPAFAFQAWFNYVRFGSILQDGHALVYNNYLGFPVPTTIFHVYNPNFKLFNFLDVRNIPLHIYTAFLLLPDRIKSFPYVSFSPFGTSVLFTSPLLLLIVNAKWHDKFVRLCAIVGTLVMLGVFLHFMQGWVQFSYRYLLDFLPFFLIVLASGIEKTSWKLTIPLLVLSIYWNVLGVIYGAR